MRSKAQSLKLRNLFVQAWYYDFLSHGLFIIISENTVTDTHNVGMGQFIHLLINYYELGTAIDTGDLPKN